jgi:HAD superfamily hydrolase (TIGR01490 family)
MVSPAYTRRVARAAAFFDLDRTLIRKSSALALAGAFRRRGLIGRGQLVKAVAWQLLFAARGASHETVRRAAEDGLMILRGVPQAELRALVAEAMERTLRPLVYGEAVDLVRQHRGRGEPTYLVSAALQEIVEAIAAEVGLDAAIGTLCETEDGVFTGRPLRAVHAEGKAAAVREAAARDGIDLAASTAYSDSHTDLPFLEAVGRPVAVNPDRSLRRIAAERSWPVLRFRRSLAAEPRVA